jgi:hypothetical protein
MKSAECPHCKEEVKAEATICKHCHERLRFSREERVMAAIMDRARVAVGAAVTIPAVSACGAFCHAHFSGDKVRLTQCLDDCKAAEAAALVAERLHRELTLTFADIVWGGGDIDPLPLERAVRSRFSSPKVP